MDILSFTSLNKFILLRFAISDRENVPLNQDSQPSLETEDANLSSLAAAAATGSSPDSVFVLRKKDETHNFQIT